MNNNFRNIAKLKIKIKHLALEPAIIRQEVKRAKKSAWYWYMRYSEDTKITENLNKYHRYTNAAVDFDDHRKDVVRLESRATQLAYAFLRGKEYSKTEKTREKACMIDKAVTRAMKIAKKYKPHNKNDDEIEREFREWMDV